MGLKKLISWSIKVFRRSIETVSRQNPKIAVNDLEYYFDAKRKDTKDQNSASDRSRKVLDLRDRLLTLSDSDFELAIKTLHGLLDQKTQDGKSDSQSGNEPNQDAVNLYEKTQANDGTATSKINPI